MTISTESQSATIHAHKPDFFCYFSVMAKNGNSIKEKEWNSKENQTSLENTALEINDNLLGFINKVEESRQVHFVFNIIGNLCIDQL